jgi:hypothetical protein
MFPSIRDSVDERGLANPWFETLDEEDALADEAVADAWRWLQDRYRQSVRPRLRKLAVISRIVGLLAGPPTQPALPPPPPPVVQPDRDRKRPRSRSKPEQSLMESLGVLAAEAQSDVEADALVGSLLPLAARQFPSAAPILRGMDSRLQRGLRQAARVMRQDPRTRAWVKTLPIIVSQAARSLEREQGRGRTLSPDLVRRVLRHQAWVVLADPTRRRRAIRQADALLI